MNIIEIDEGGRLLVCGLNVMANKIENDKEYQVKFDVKRSDKDGVSVSKVIISEKIPDKK